MNSKSQGGALNSPGKTVLRLVKKAFNYKALSLNKVYRYKDFFRIVNNGIDKELILIQLQFCVEFHSGLWDNSNQSKHPIMVPPYALNLIVKPNHLDFGY